MCAHSHDAEICQIFAPPRTARVWRLGKAWLVTGKSTLPPLKPTPDRRAKTPEPRVGHSGIETRLMPVTKWRGDNVGTDRQNLCYEVMRCGNVCVAEQPMLWLLA